MRLELGSGERPTVGFTTLDIRHEVKPDILDDAASLEKVLWSSCDEIRACHLLEHFSHRDSLHIVRTWVRRLKPDGRLYVEVPNLSGHIRAWNQNEESDDELVVFLYGGQDYPDNTHRTAFTATTLERVLRHAGLKRITVQSFGMVLGAEGYR